MRTIFIHALRSRRGTSYHRERVGFLIRIKEWIKVIQSVFNGTTCLFRRHLGFHFRVIFGRQIYFSQIGRQKA